MSHALRSNDRKISAPVIGYKTNEDITIPENHLSRTDEIENIPVLMDRKEQQPPAKVVFTHDSHEGCVLFVVYWLI